MFQRSLNKRSQGLSRSAEYVNLALCLLRKIKAKDQRDLFQASVQVNTFLRRKEIVARWIPDQITEELYRALNEAEEILDGSNRKQETVFSTVLQSILDQLLGAAV